MTRASPLALLTDKRQRGLMLGRLRAWWDGATFDEAAFEAAQAAQAEALEQALFEADPVGGDPRLDALARFWGRGRIFPGDANLESGLPALLGLSATARLGVLAPGLAAPVEAIAAAHPGPILALEWRTETRAALKGALFHAKLARAEAASFDLDTGAIEPESLDGLVGFDPFTHCDNPGRLAAQVAKGLRGGAQVWLEIYAGDPGPAAAQAFAAAFGEPQVRAADALLGALREAGLEVTADEEVTEAHIGLAREGFKALAGGIEAGDAPDAAALREIAWEAQSWGVRLKLLASGRLQRRRIRAVKPG